MKKAYFIIISLVLLTVLSGCFYPVPLNLNGTTMVAGHTGTGFGIAGDNLSGFVWHLDGDLLEGQTSALFFYNPGIDDVGQHELRVDFYQNSTSYYWIWKINVNPPPSGDAESQPVGK